MDVMERLALVTREPTEEVITRDELKTLLETKSHPRHYIGLEISGILHLGSLIVTGFKINDFIKAGINCTVFLADWHTYINDKLGGDWDRIRQVSQYYAEAFRFFCPGVNIVTGTDLYKRTPAYWENFVRFAKHMTLARTLRSLTIMGRGETGAVDLSQLLYPPMQSVDIWALDLDIVHSGMDQRKIHMLAREVFPKMGWKAPVCVHHHLLPGLSEPVRLGLDEDAAEDARVSSKMSKTKPASGILVHDDEKAIRQEFRRLWDLNLFDQLTIESRQRLPGVYDLIFHVRDRPLISARVASETERPRRRRRWGRSVSFSAIQRPRSARARRAPSRRR